MPALKPSGAVRPHDTPIRTALKPVQTIQLHITRNHIAQARALQRTAYRWQRSSICHICPIALAAREFFARPCKAGRTTIGVMDEQDEYITVFFHNGEEAVEEFDEKGTCSPITLTLTRSF
jgi:hypothetical protein